MATVARKKLPLTGRNLEPDSGEADICLDRLGWVGRGRDRERERETEGGRRGR